MSHFTVLVIGENPEQQLAPYQQNNMGDCPKEYLQWVSVENDYDSIEDAILDGYKVNNGVPGYFENPNAKWDWYLLGGRWAGFFKVKKGAVGIQGHHIAKDFAKLSNDVVEDIPALKVDQCLKKDLDIDGMRMEARINALKDYQAFITALGDNEIPPKWDEFRSRYIDIDTARAVYRNLESVKSLHKEHIFFFDEFYCTEEEYLSKAESSVLQTFALLKNGKWYERGKMGWWGIVTDENNNWDKEFIKLFNELPSDTLLSVYDCHI